MFCGLSRRLSKSFSRNSRSESKREKKKEHVERKDKLRRRSLDDLNVEIMAEFSSATIYDEDQDMEQGPTSHTEMMSGQHNWYACSHARPTYCNICRDALSGVTSHGLSCEASRGEHRRGPCACALYDTTPDTAGTHRETPHMKIYKSSS